MDMSYSAPVEEQRFLLNLVTGIGALAEHDGFAAATPDMVDAILEGAAQFADGVFAPLNESGDREGAQWTPEGVVMPDGFKQAYAAYVEGGWGTLSCPEAFGGQGLPFSLATAVLDDLGAANLAFSLIMMLTPGAVEALVAHGSADQQERWLPRLVSGEWNGTMNLTEPQAGSDVGALKTRAEKLPDGRYRIKGGKIFITFGDHDLTDNIVHLVLARTTDAPPGTKGVSLFIVPKYRDGEDGRPVSNDVRCVSIEHKLGIHASPTCVMSFGDNDDCIGEIVGAENTGMKAMFTMMNNARLNVGLQGVAIAERATQKALVYARERVQSARAGAAARTPVAIVEHPDVRRMLLTMRAKTDAARGLIYYAAGLVDRAHLGDTGAQKRLDLLTPIAKIHGTDTGCEVASIGVQVHGGMGYVEETGAAQYYRDARITPIYEGTNGIQAADLVGRKIGMDDGAVIADLLAEIGRDGAGEKTLLSLVNRVETATRHLLDPAVSLDDRLAASVPYAQMLAVAVCGWIMAMEQAGAKRLLAAGEGDPSFLNAKLVTTRFYLDQIVPQAEGLFAAATASAAVLYDFKP